MPPEDFHDLINALASTPETLTGLVKDLSPADLRFKNLPDEFSVIEGVCHLRDIEIEGYAVRIRRILSEDKPLLPDIDGGQLAVERNYHHQELAPALQAFSSAREKNAQALTGLTSEQLDREGTLEGVGTITIRQLMAMMTEHDEDHIRELSAIRRRVVKR
jgi:DinB superfamily